MKDHEKEIKCECEALKQLTHGNYSIIDMSRHNEVFVAFREVLNRHEDDLSVKALIAEASVIVGYDIWELF